MLFEGIIIDCIFKKHQAFFILYKDELSKARKRCKNGRQHNQRCKKSFQTKKEIDDNKIKDIKNLFKLEQ